MARILLAEDDPVVREFVTRALEARGHQVVAVGDGPRVLDILSTSRFDLVVSNIVLPGMDGIALAFALAKDHPEIPVLLMSGHSAERPRTADSDDPAREVQPEPFTLQQVCDAVDAALRPKRH